MSDLIRISEIFGPTIQGEGALIGEPTVFVRTGGCDFRCAWCDSLHAVDQEYRDQWAAISAKDILDQVRSLARGPILITLSGGNPAIQPLGPLINAGHADGYRFAMETQGSVARSWFGKLDMLVLSPKPPSSGMETDWQALDKAAQSGAKETVLKVVVFDEADYHYARDVAARYPDLPLYLQPGNHTPPPPDAEPDVDQEGINVRMRWLVERTIQDGWYRPRILPQLHVMLWGNKRGV